MPGRAGVCGLVLAGSKVAPTSAASSTQASGDCAANAQAGGSSMARCVIAHQSITGDYATSLVTGKAMRPASLAVVIYTRPPQRVRVSWAIDCSVGAA
jgi:hypothetical protein